MFVGVDVGTQSLKVAVVDGTFGLRGEASTSYRPDYPKPGWVEQSPSLWEAALQPAIAAALRRAGATPHQVESIGVCGQLDGCVAVDDDGHPLSSCLIWMDRRAQAEISDVSPAVVRERAGVVLDPGHMAAKIRWLKRHHPAKAARFHQPVSFLVDRLTGVAVMDHALASTTMLYNIQQRAFDPVLLDCFGISVDELPALADASDRAGPMSAAGAVLTGLPEGIPVAVGTGDDFSTPLGGGLAAPGRLVVVLGTGEVVGLLHERPLVDADGLVETHAYPGGSYFLENPGWLAGGAVAWLTDLLKFDDFADFDAAAGSVPAGAEGLIFIPALTGALAPRWHAGARGCFYGLTPSHGRAHLARALLEGCAFAARDVADRLRQMGAEFGGLLMLGGGTRSRLWAQIHADVLGLPAELPERVDTSPIGAALLAATAAGHVPNLREGAARLGRDAATLKPEVGHRDAYRAAYDRYRRLFAALEPMFS